MPNFEKSKGFKMEPKGLYKKQMGERGIPKYGLMEDTPTMKDKKAKIEAKVNFNNPNIEKKYKESKEFRDYLKNEKGVTYDPETRKSTKRTPVSKMSDTIKMDRLMAKYKEPMAAHHPMTKYDDMPKYNNTRNGSLMKKDYMLRASKAEVMAAKQEAIDCGFDPEKADDVFKKYKK